MDYSTELSIVTALPVSDFFRLLLLKKSSSSSSSSNSPPPPPPPTAAAPVGAGLDTALILGTEAPFSLLSIESESFPELNRLLSARRKRLDLFEDDQADEKMMSLFYKGLPGNIETAPAGIFFPGSFMKERKI